MTDPAMPDEGAGQSDVAEGDQGNVPIAVAKPSGLAWAALAACLCLIFYLAFFPRSFVARASALTGLLTGILTLIGFKVREPRQLVESFDNARTVAFCKRAVLVTGGLLFLGVARPMTLMTLPGSDVYLDGSYHSTIPLTAPIDGNGLATIRIYTSWERHDVAVEKKYFADPDGHRRPSTHAQWWQFRAVPQVALRLRACLGRPEPVEWEGLKANMDFDSMADVGHAAFQGLLRGVNRLAGSRYPHSQPAFPISVQCGATVTLSDRVVQNPFEPGEYIGVTLEPGVQIRVPLEKNEPMPARVSKPAEQLATALLRVLGVGDPDLEQQLVSATNAELMSVLAATADDRAAATLKSLGELMQSYLGRQFSTPRYPCVPPGRTLGPAQGEQIRSSLAELPRYKRLVSERVSVPFLGGRQVVESLAVLGRAARVLKDELVVTTIGALLSDLTTESDSSVKALAMEGLRQFQEPIEQLPTCPW